MSKYPIAEKLIEARTAREKKFKENTKTCLILYKTMFEYLDYLEHVVCNAHNDFLIDAVIPKLTECYEILEESEKIIEQVNV